MGHLKNLWRKIAPNPLDTQLKKAVSSGHKNILIVWNRGLGDIALGIYTLVMRIREFIPDAKLTFLTRADLADGFSLLNDVDVVIAPELTRGQSTPLAELLKDTQNDFDLIFDNPDLTWWLQWQLGKVTPRLEWNPLWDALNYFFDFEDDVRYVGVHVQTETQYNYEKNWPLEAWNELFDKLTKEHRCHVILFGFRQDPAFPQEGIVDLRGKTDLLSMLSIIKNRCSYLVVPDSGVLSLTYYLDVAFPLHIVSLWADPRQGVLKQNVASPNPQLLHSPLLGQKEDIRTIAVDEVLQKLFPKGSS